MIRGKNLSGPGRLRTTRHRLRVDSRRAAHKIVFASSRTCHRGAIKEMAARRFEPLLVKERLPGIKKPIVIITWRSAHFGNPAPGVFRPGREKIPKRGRTQGFSAPFLNFLPAINRASPVREAGAESGPVRDRWSCRESCWRMEPFENRRGHRTRRGGPWEFRRRV
jgi:hypothetical protein